MLHFLDVISRSVFSALFLMIMLHQDGVDLELHIDGINSLLEANLLDAILIHVLMYALPIHYSNFMLA